MSERKEWGFSISPYAWLAGMSTDVGGEKIRQSFNDLFSISKFGFQILASARYKRVEGTGDQALETMVSAFGPMLGVSFVL